MKSFEITPAVLKPRMDRHGMVKPVKTDQPSAPGSQVKNVRLFLHDGGHDNYTNTLYENARANDIWDIGIQIRINMHARLLSCRVCARSSFVEERVGVCLEKGCDVRSGCIKHI